MARTGSRLRQGDSDELIFRTTTGDSAGVRVEVEARYAPMREIRPPVHSHPAQDEHFEVLSGVLDFLIEGERVRVGPGEVLDIPRGQRHTVWNASDEHTRFRWRTSPALRTERMYEVLWGLAAEGRMGRHGHPRPALLQGAVLMFAYRREYRLASPPYPALVLGCGLLGAIGRLAGYRPWYGRYAAVDGPDRGNQSRQTFFTEP